MPIDTYEDDEEEQEGPRSSFGTYLAEGDALFKQSEYKKALESYSLALELQPNDKICLVARSKCYLKLGDPQKALQDAEDALAEDKEFNKGLYRKAEALYCMGDFEYALMYYHRGHKLRPELDEFRLGIQKAQEAIDNSIGSAAKIKLENKGDLSFFTKQDDMVNKKQRAGYLKPVTNTKKLKPLANRNKEVKTPAPSKKTVKQLLGELYSDKEYFEKLMEDEAFIKSPQNNQIYELVQGGLNYLETRTEFWRQQKPLYARKKDKPKFNTVTKKTAQGVSKFILKQLQEVDQALSYGNADRSLRLAQKLLKSVEGINKDDLPSKSDVIANIHSCIGNAYIELEHLPKALRHHEKDLQMSKLSKANEGISRALDNIGRVHARMGNFKKAVTSWNDKLPLVKTAIESTWLCHEIGRCYLELGNYDKSLEFGQKSLAAARECEDSIWQLNATVLLAQSHVKLGSIDDAIQTFTSGLELALVLDDTSAQSAISKALSELQRRSSLASGRNTSHSENEGSPRIQSDMDDRSDEGSRKQSPVLVDNEEKPEVHEDTREDSQEDTGNETNNDDHDTPQIVNVPDASGAEQDPRVNEVLHLNSEPDQISLHPEIDIHIQMPSMMMDNTVAGNTDKEDASGENDVDDSDSNKAEEEIEQTENQLTLTTAEDKSSSFVDSDMPLTSDGLNRDASAEKLESVPNFTLSGEDVASQHTVIGDDVTPNGSMEQLVPATVSADHFISPMNTVENLTADSVKVATEATEEIASSEDTPPVENSVAEASENTVSEKTNSEQEITEDSSKPPAPVDVNEEVSVGENESNSLPETSDNLTSQAESTENTISHSLSTDNNTIPANENEATSENITSSIQSSDNVESLVEPSDNATSSEEKKDEVSESHNDQSESLDVSAASVENTSADITSEALVDEASLVQEASGTETGNGGAANSELETAQDLSQSSNIDELPMDSSRATPEATTTEATEQDAGTTEETPTGETDGVTDGAVDTGTTDAVSHVVSQETIDSSMDEIPLDTSQTHVSIEETSHVTEDSSKLNSEGTTADVNKATNDGNTSITDTAPEDKT